ncbi:MAG: VWA domain-containing protein [Eubacteriaceae bacterium]|nr:VWA domain-containing protein [Eubacteriaceae bacterium]
MLSDHHTSRFSDYFEPSSIDNGHIWVDKTVNTGDIIFYDHQGDPIHTVHANMDEFLITLSALSQSYTVDVVDVPTDTVFVLDVSSSMYIYKMGAETRAQVMVKALNKAIHTILDADQNNRIAVVAYGGYASGLTNMSRAEQILKLGHYNIAGDFFSIIGSSITVSPSIPAEMVVSKTVAVNGATPTQRGIYAGARIFVENHDTAYSYTTEKGRLISITRRPIMLLLTDGEPTFGWDDYEMQDPGSDKDGGYNHGNGDPTFSIDIGTDILTVLTASYWKQRIHDHYYGTEKRNEMQIYTVGLDVSGVHAPSVMDPFNNAVHNTQSFGSELYNMQELLDKFVNPEFGIIEFPALLKGSTSARSLVTIENKDNYIKSYNYATSYFAADNAKALDDAFKSIAQNIVTSGAYTTESDPSHPDFSGYVTVVDPLGQYMQFKEFKGTWIGGEMFYGNVLAKSIVDEPPGGLLLDYWASSLASRMGFGKSAATELIAGSIASGEIYYNADDDYGCSMKWYADYDSNFLGNFYDRYGELLAVPSNAASIVRLLPMHNVVYNEQTGEDSNLLHLYLEIITTLEEGDFNLRGYSKPTISLAKGQQMVVWFIPASLIPMRTISETHDEEHPDRIEILEIKEVFPIRTNYTVGMAEGFEWSQLSEQYKENNKSLDGKGVCFYSNDWSAQGSEDGNSSFAIFEPNKNNPYYYFTEDTHVYTTLDGTNYTLAESYSPNTDYYVIQDYFDQDIPGYIAQLHILLNQQVTQILLGPMGEPYVPSGERKENSITLKTKVNNLTQTSDHNLEAGYYGGIQVNRLGNNGRLEMHNPDSLIVDEEEDITLITDEEGSLFDGFRDVDLDFEGYTEEEANSYMADEQGARNEQARDNGDNSSGAAYAAIEKRSRASYRRRKRNQRVSSQNALKCSECPQAAFQLCLLPGECTPVPANIAAFPATIYIWVASGSNEVNILFDNKCQPIIIHPAGNKFKIELDIQINRTQHCRIGIDVELCTANGTVQAFIPCQECSIY